MENLTKIFKLVSAVWKKKDEPLEKLLNISSIFHKQSHFFHQLFADMDGTEKSKLLLDFDIKELDKSIALENNDQQKCIKIFSYFHLVFYQLLQDPSVYYLIYHGKEEMATKLSQKITFYAQWIKNDEHNIIFQAFMLLYAFESRYYEHLYVSIDFEYAGTVTKLMQLSFEHETDFRTIIFIVGPDQMEDIMKTYVDLLLCNRHIKKLMHGSEAKDIPYLFNQVFHDDPHLIMDFTQSFIDTRYMCEFYKFSHNEVEVNKCSIYSADAENSAIYYFGLINKEQHVRLGEFESMMPSYETRIWNVHSMPKSQIQYAAYDVIFLKYFYYKMIQKATETLKSEAEIKSTISLYSELISEVAQYVFLSKRKIVELTEIVKLEGDAANNYFIKMKGGGTCKLIDIFKDVNQDIFVPRYHLNLEDLLKVSFFKLTTTILLKRICYVIIMQHHRVYKNKINMWTDKLNNRFVFESLNNNKFYHLENLMKYVAQMYEKKITKL